MGASIRCLARWPWQSRSTPSATAFGRPRRCSMKAVIRAGRLMALRRHRAHPASRARGPRRRYESRSRVAVRSQHRHSRARGVSHDPQAHRFVLKFPVRLTPVRGSAPMRVLERYTRLQGARRCRTAPSPFREYVEWLGRQDPKRRRVLKRLAGCGWSHTTRRSATAEGASVPRYGMKRARRTARADHERSPRGVRHTGSRDRWQERGRSSCVDSEQR